MCDSSRMEKTFNAQRPTPNAQRPLDAAKVARTFENRSPRIGRWTLGVGHWALNAGWFRAFKIPNVNPPTIRSGTCKQPRGFFVIRHSSFVIRPLPAHG